MSDFVATLSELPMWISSSFNSHDIQKYPLACAIMAHKSNPRQLFFGDTNSSIHVYLNVRFSRRRIVLALVAELGAS